MKCLYHDEANFPDTVCTPVKETLPNIHSVKLLDRGPFEACRLYVELFHEASLRDDI